MSHLASPVSITLHLLHDVVCFHSEIFEIFWDMWKNCASPQPFIAFLRCSRPWSLGVACSPSQTPSIAIANPSFADSGIADITSIPIKIYKNYDFGYFGDFWNCFVHTFPHCIRCIITIWYDLYRFVSGPGSRWSSGSMMELPHNDPLLGGEATSGGWSCHWSLVVWHAWNAHLSTLPSTLPDPKEHHFQLSLLSLSIKRQSKLSKLSNLNILNFIFLILILSNYMVMFLPWLSHCFAELSECL